MIICGTDLSESSAATARVAGSIAQALGRPLLLVHVVSDAPRGTLESRLGAQADDLRLRFDIAVEARLERGAPDERLVALADELQAQLLVVSALGDRRQHRWLLGSVAERVAQASPVPVLVVRDGGRLEAWARGQGALRVMVGVELTPASQVALRWARGLRAIGPCELLVTYVAWPPAEHRRLDATSPVPLDRLGPGLEDTLLRALEEWAGESPRAAGTSFVVRPGWGRVDGHLTQLAIEQKADLVVVGTHQRAGIARLWQGSVSRGVLHGAPVSVACVPPHVRPPHEEGEDADELESR